MPESVFYSEVEVDYHTLLKVVQTNFALGIIQVHCVTGGYAVNFVDCVENAKEIFQKRVEDLKQNRLAH